MLDLSSLGNLAPAGQAHLKAQNSWAAVAVSAQARAAVLPGALGQAEELVLTSPPRAVATLASDAIQDSQKQGGGRHLCPAHCTPSIYTFVPCIPLSHTFSPSAPPRAATGESLHQGPEFRQIGNRPCLRRSLPSSWKGQPHGGWLSDRVMERLCWWGILEPREGWLCLCIPSGKESG